MQADVIAVVCRFLVKQLSKTIKFTSKRLLESFFHWNYIGFVVCYTQFFILINTCLLFVNLRYSFEFFLIYLPELFEETLHMWPNALMNVLILLFEVKKLVVELGDDFKLTGALLALLVHLVVLYVLERRHVFWDIRLQPDFKVFQKPWIDVFNYLWVHLVDKIHFWSPYFQRRHSLF